MNELTCKFNKALCMSSDRESKIYSSNRCRKIRNRDKIIGYTLNNQGAPLNYDISRGIEDTSVKYSSRYNKMGNNKLLFIKYFINCCI